MDKEALQKKRRQAYLAAKAKRDADPRYQQLKEDAKQKRKAQYQAIRTQIKDAKRAERDKRIAEKDAALMALVFPASMLEMNNEDDDHKA